MYALWRPSLLKASSAAWRACGGGGCSRFRLLLNTVYFSDRSIKDRQYAQKRVVSHQWSETDKYICRGMLYPFIHSIKNAADPLLKDTADKAGFGRI